MSIFKGFIAVMVVIALGLLLMLGFGVFKKETADFRGSVDQAERVEANGAYRIAQYEHFYDLCASIQGKEATIANLTAELETASEERAEQIRATLSAVKSERERSIAQYNVDARKGETQAKFHASDLPYQLDAKEKETKCEA